jgi:hypothetical protein
MRHHLSRGTAVLTGIVFVLSFAGRNAAVPKRAAEEPDIVIHFYGLMVFGDVVGGQEVVRLNAHAQNHRLSIETKGPLDVHFHEWADEYKDDSNPTLEVTKSDHSPANDAEWGASMPRPFPIAVLHPETAQLGKLSIKNEKLKPTFTVNSGTFSGTSVIDWRCIYFENQAHDSDNHRDDAPQEVVAKIYLGGGTAVLKRKTSSGVESISLIGRPWEINVLVEPKPGHEHDEYHFVYYYRSFEMKKGSSNSDIEKSKRYRAKRRDPGQDHCPAEFTLFGIPERPCIPIWFQG